MEVHEKEFHLAEYNQVTTTMEALMERVADITKLGIFATGAVFAWIATSAFETTDSGAICAKFLADWAAYIPPAMILFAGLYSAAAANRWIELQKYVVTLEAALAADSLKGLNRHRTSKSWILAASIVGYAAFFIGSGVVAWHLDKQISTPNSKCVAPKAKG